MKNIIILLLLLRPCLNFREVHQEIKDGYDRLHRISLSGPESQEFVEPRVQVLWTMAVKGNFSDSELESMRVSFEKRYFKTELSDIQNQSY